MKKSYLYFALIAYMLCFGIFTSCSKEGGGGNEIIDENTNVLDKITDPNFKAYIVRYVEMASPDILTVQEAAKVETIEVRRWQIQSLEGLEYFTGLKKLDCSSNKLSSLDLSKNPKLEHLRCSDCGLQAINLSNNRELKYLYCEKNELQLLDLSSCPKIDMMECHNNELVKLDVSKNKQLRYLDCEINKITGTMDVSSCTALRVLRVNKNQLTAIKLNSEIESLYCESNDLSALDLVKYTSLTNLRCNQNPKMLSLDISKNKNLRFIKYGSISAEPPAILYVWWDILSENVWDYVPSGMSLSIGENVTMKTKK